MGLDLTRPRAAWSTSRTADVWKRERGTQTAEKRAEDEEAVEDPGKRAGRRRGADRTRRYVQPENWAELYRRR